MQFLTRGSMHTHSDDSFACPAAASVSEGGSSSKKLANMWKRQPQTEQSEAPGKAKRSKTAAA